MSDPPDVPKAVLKPRRRLSAAWVVPLAALALAGWLGYSAWAGKGLRITVQLDEGHGLKAGDEVRYHGTSVGEVERVELAPGGEGIVVTARLAEPAARLARAGSRFWVVRPQLGLGGIEGLETLIGPRYLAFLPGDGGRQRHFLGLAEPPVVDAIEPGDLEIILTTPRRGSLRRGAAVTYRQVRVGTVLSVGLASDGGVVEARVHIEQAYVQLIRSETRFWAAGGLQARVGLSGVTLELETIEQLVSGGVALATPPGAGEVVRTGHRFSLASEPPEDWLQWQPLVVIGNEMLPPGAPAPHPLRARLEVRRGRWIGRDKSVQGWVLQMEAGLLGPADLLRGPEEADRETPALEVAGTVHPLEGTPLWSERGLSMIDLQVTEAFWPRRRTRRPESPEDCVAIADPAAAPLPLAEARLEAGDEGWAVDPAVAVDESWHGASVVSRADGYLVGLLLVADGTARVALLPAR